SVPGGMPTRVPRMSITGLAGDAVSAATTAAPALWKMSFTCASSASFRLKPFGNANPSIAGRYITFMCPSFARSARGGARARDVPARAAHARGVARAAADTCRPWWRHMREDERSRRLEVELAAQGAAEALDQRVVEIVGVLGHARDQIEDLAAVEVERR